MRKTTMGQGMRSGPWWRYPYSYAARPRRSASAGAPSSSASTKNRSSAPSAPPPTCTGTWPSGTPACALLPFPPLRLTWDDGGSGW